MSLKTTCPGLLARVLLASLMMPFVAAAQAQDTTALEVHEASVLELSAALAEGHITSAALVDAYLARIAAYDQSGPALNAVLRLNPAARQDADALDRERQEQGPRGPLHGIPVLLKDNYETAGLPTSGGSLALAGWVPSQDAAVVQHLRTAGAIILGQTSMHELASGITNISSIGGQTRNPYDPARNPGGSSGGTGAAVAASFAAIGWGSDTCGSIRIPAAHQNLYGLRPTRGLFSTEGIIPLSLTQDVPGPLARTVTDLALGLDATLDARPAQATPQTAGVTRMPRFMDALPGATLNTVRVGILTNFFGDVPEEQEPLRLVRAAIDTMRAHGVEVIEITIPDLDSLIAGTSLIQHEFKWDLQEFLAERPEAPVRSLSEIRASALHHQALDDNFRRRDVEAQDDSAYTVALERQAHLREVMAAALSQDNLTALVYPTMRRKPAPIGEAQFGTTCQLSAATGFPAITLPAGFTADGLPIAVELMGAPMADENLVAIAYAYEQLVKPRRAPSSTPPLVGGRAPSPVRIGVEAQGPAGESVSGTLVYDVTRSTLEYTVGVRGVSPADVYAVTLDRMAGEEKGPSLYRLILSGDTAQGTIPLTYADRNALREGRLSINLFTRQSPAGAAQALIRLPD